MPVPGTPYSAYVTDEIKALVRDEMERQGLSVAALARELGTSRANLSRLLSSSNSDARAGSVAFWLRLFARLGLEVTARKP